MTVANKKSIGALSWNMANKEIDDADIATLISENNLSELDGIVIGAQEEARSGEYGTLRCTLAHKIAGALGDDYKVVTQSGYYTRTKISAEGEGQVSLAVVMKKGAGDSTVTYQSDKYQEADGLLSAKNKGGTTQQITVAGARFNVASAHLASYTDSRKIVEFNEVASRMYQQRLDENVTYEQLEAMSSDQDIILMDANYRNIFDPDNKNTPKSPYAPGGPAAHINVQGFKLAECKKSEKSEKLPHSYFKNSSHNDDKDHKRKVGQSGEHYTRGGLVDQIAFLFGEKVELDVIEGMTTPGMDHKPVFAKLDVDVSETPFLRTQKWVLQSLQSLSAVQPEGAKIAQEVLDRVADATDTEDGKDLIQNVYNYYCIGVRAIQVKAELYKAEGKAGFATALNGNEGMAKYLMQVGNIHFSVEGSDDLERGVKAAVDCAYQQAPALRYELSIFKIIANVFLKLANCKTYKPELEKRSSLLTSSVGLFSNRCNDDAERTQYNTPCSSPLRAVARA